MLASLVSIACWPLMAPTLVTCCGPYLVYSRAEAHALQDCARHGSVAPCVPCRARECREYGEAMVFYVFYLCCGCGALEGQICALMLIAFSIVNTGVCCPVLCAGATVKSFRAVASTRRPCLCFNRHCRVRGLCWAPCITLLWALR